MLNNTVSGVNTSKTEKKNLSSLESLGSTYTSAQLLDKTSSESNANNVTQNNLETWMGLEMLSAQYTSAWGCNHNLVELPAILHCQPEMNRREAHFTMHNHRV